MHRNGLGISAVISGLVLFCAGVGAGAAAGEVASTGPGAAARDAAVLQIVFDDMMSKENKEAPYEWNGDPAKPVYVSKYTPERRPDAAAILLRHDSKKWEALTGSEAGAAREAAEDLVVRAGKGEKLPVMRSTNGRLKIFEEAGAATQPKAGEPWSGERASRVYLPGYSRDGRYAVVRLAFPWSGIMHSGEVTYVLERTEKGWRVLLRDFVFYV